MKLSTALYNKRLGVVVTALLALTLLPLGSSLVRFAFARGDQMEGTFLEQPDTDEASCVRETEYMRFHHMDLLKQIREEFIRDGIRGSVSLKNCRSCHPSRARFCDQCHEAASVILDCFGCHYYPEPGSETQQLGT